MGLIIARLDMGLPDDRVSNVHTKAFRLGVEDWT